MLVSIATPFLWVAFSVFVVAVLILDLGIFNRRPHKLSIKESLIWTVIWISAALIFNLAVWYFFGKVHALEFLTGYLIEKSLSVDNLFIFLIIFSYFNVPPIYQHRVLIWGILGALLMRALFIWLGAVLMQNFHWVIYPFGLILLFTGLKLLKKPSSKAQPEKMLIVRLARYLIPMTPTFEGKAFFVVKNKKIHATPLFLVLLAIESTDLIFAIDSIPAIFAITTDPFIVYTSNIFAMLGLRSLYFALSEFLQRIYYLRYGLAVILAFIGIKMLLTNVIHVPVIISLVVIISILTIATLASLLSSKKHK